jgi:toxin ParE1/3/4
MMRVRISRRAEMDLAEITDYIAADNPKGAYEFEDKLLEQAQKISLAPLGYVERVELRKGIRSCAYGPYVIFFPGAVACVIRCTQQSSPEYLRIQPCETGYPLRRR